MILLINRCAQISLICLDFITPTSPTGNTAKHSPTCNVAIFSFEHGFKLLDFLLILSEHSILGILIDFWLVLDIFRPEE